VEEGKRYLVCERERERSEREALHALLKAHSATHPPIEEEMGKDNAKEGQLAARETKRSFKGTHCLSSRFRVKGFRFEFSCINISIPLFDIIILNLMN